MKAVIKPAALIAASVLWLCIYELVIFDRGSHFSQPVAAALTVLLLISGVILPFVGFRIFKTQRRGSLFGLLLFIASLVPAVVSLTVIGFGILVSQSLRQ